jgi:hypothetical protein
VRVNRSTLKLIANVLFLVVISACTTYGTFKPDKDRNVILLQFHERDNIEEYCGKGLTGCHKVTNNAHTIHSIKEWCVLNHEIAHVIKGSYHVKGAGCKALPE